MSRSVRGVVVVDLRRYVDQDGRLTDEGEVVAWEVLADLAPDRHVRVQIGSCVWVTARFLEQLGEYLAQAGSVVVEGTRQRAVDAVTAACERVA